MKFAFTHQYVTELMSLFPHQLRLNRYLLEATLFKTNNELFQSSVTTFLYTHINVQFTARPRKNESIRFYLNITLHTLPFMKAFDFGVEAGLMKLLIILRISASNVFEICDIDTFGLGTHF